MLINAQVLLITSYNYTLCLRIFDLSKPKPVSHSHIECIKPPNTKLVSVWNWLQFQQIEQAINLVVVIFIFMSFTISCDFETASAVAISIVQCKVYCNSHYKLPRFPINLQLIQNYLPCVVAEVHKSHISKILRYPQYSVRSFKFSQSFNYTYNLHSLTFIQPSFSSLSLLC